MLRPGGRVCILEITRPKSGFANGALRTFMTGVIPAFADQPAFAETEARFRGEAVAAVVGTPQAIPLAGLINIERRHGKDEFVIEKALVKMDSPAMQFFASRRGDWAARDLFCSPGPRQFWGPTTHQQPISVALNSGADSLMFRIG